MTLLDSKREAYWKRLGINDEESLKKYIVALFEKHEHQGDVIRDLYILVFPEWDRIKRIDGYPEVGDALWKFITIKFQEFDQKHHPKCLPGGAWMNSGFSFDHKLPPWSVSLKLCTVEYE